MTKSPVSTGKLPLLGTPEQVSLAVEAANDMVAGRSVETAALVVSLRTFIREVLDLDAVPINVAISKHGPLHPAGGSAQAGRGESAGGSGARRRRRRVKWYRPVARP